jgi:hypothetical protein
MRMGNTMIGDAGDQFGSLASRFQSARWFVLEVVPKRWEF